MKKLYFFMSALLACLQAQAQVASYVFSQSTGSYSLITGGSLLGASGADDSVYGVVLPFSFTFDGTTYASGSTVRVSTNGFISFGATTPSSGLYTPLSSSTGFTGTVANANVIAAAASDLYSNDTGGQLRYQTIGTAPNRTLVFQWRNFIRYAQGNYQTSDIMGFQIRLYETSNVIDLVYSGFTMAAVSSTVQVGLRGAGSLYNNRTTTTNWASSTAGATASASMALDASVKPSNGLKFTFTPGATSVDMAATAINNIPTGNCPALSQPLAVTIKNNGSGPIDFTTNNATVAVNITGASTQTLTATVSTGTLNPGASQQVVVTPNAVFSATGTHTIAASVTVTGDGNTGNNSTAASKVVSINTTSPFAETFATAALPSGWGNSGFAFANNHAVSSFGIYKNQFNSSTTGQFSTLSVGPLDSNDELKFDYRILDYNFSYPGTQLPPTGNWGNFKVQISTDCGATFADLETIDNSNHLVTDQSFTTKKYPLDAYAGQYVTIRIVAAWASGDYYLDFDNFSIAPVPLTAPDCITSFTPANAATNVARNATLTWAEPSGLPISYDVYFGTDATPSFVANTTGLSYAPALMDANTQYFWKVIPKNANGDATGCTVQSFTTGNSLFYCTPTYANDCASGNVIDSFSLNALSNLNSGCSGNANNYIQYPATGSNTTSLKQGLNYNAMVTLGNGGSGNVAIWIDYNDNATFESSERYQNTTLIDPSTMHPIAINIPADAALGTHVMRVRSVTSGSLQDVDPCSNENNGETEDYTITIIAAQPPTIVSLGATSGCEGQTIVINGTNFTGVSAADVTIGGTAVASILSNNGSVITAIIGAGTTGLVSVTNADGTGTSATPFTVNALPGAVASSNSPVCSGSAINLTGMSDGATFAWTGPNGFTSDEQNPMIPAATMAASGTYTFTATSAAGCSYSATTSVVINLSVVYYADADGDTFGDAAATQTSCTGTPVGYVLDNTDCDDTNGSIHQSFDFYADADGDTFGTGAAVSVCAIDANTPPSGYSVNNTDCDDANASIHQSFDFYADADGDSFGTGTAISVCAADANTPPTGYSTNNSDCDDTDATKHQSFDFYADADGDTFGTGTAVSVCAVDANTPPSGYSVNNTDCDDADTTKHQSFDFYVDADGDTFGTGTAVSVCAVDANTAPSGYSVNNTDCDDADATKHQSFDFYVDADGDSFGTGTVVSVCAVDANTPPSGYSVNNTDCDDADATKHQSFDFYVDADGDSFGTGTVVSVCAVDANTPPSGYSVNNTDCDDTDAADHQSFSFYVDADGDTFGTGTVVSVCAADANTPPTGFSTNNTDCDDANVSIHQSFSFYVDADGDTFGTGTVVSVCAVDANTPPSGYSVNNTDCDDADATKHQSFDFYVDADGDTFGTGTAISVCAADANTPPSGYSVNNTDCDDANASIHQSFDFYVDADGDNFGTGTVVNVCAVDADTPPSGYSVNNTDCDDTDATKHQSFDFYVDADGDSFGTGTAVSVCAVDADTPPTGFSTNNTDCDDTNASIHQSFSFYVDADGDTFGNGTAVSVCAADANTPPAGYSVNDTDCDDNNVAVHQGFEFYADADGDNFGTGTVVNVCAVDANTPPSGYSVNNTDCDDTDATKHQSFDFYADADGDSFGTGTVVSVCAVDADTPPTGFSTNNTDCDDTNASIHQSFSFYVDADGDTFGNGTAVSVCAADANTPPAGYSVNDTDCDDNNVAVHQGFEFYADADGDAFGAGNLILVCAVDANTPPAGYSVNNTDCDDNNATVHQGFAFYVDADGDTFGSGESVLLCAADANTPPAGYAVNNGDCDDTNAAVQQGFAFYVDADGDSYGAGGTVLVCSIDANTPPPGYSLNNTDCDDTNAFAHQSFNFYTDADGDGFGSGTAVSACAADANTPPAGYSNNNSDCNDADFAINPGHDEVLYNGIDDNCDSQLDEGHQITTSLLPAVCGTTLASIGSLVGITTVSSAITGYRIKITNGAQVQIIEKNVPHFTFPQFPSYAYATTYSVEIELQRYGIWLGYYGPACLVSTPAILAPGGATSVSPSQCGLTLPKINTLIATTSLAGVTGYRFQVTNLTDPTGPNAVQTIDRAQNWFSLPMLARYNYGTTYRIEIAIKTTGTFGGYGAPCEVMSPLAPSLSNCGGIAASGTSAIATASVLGATQYRFEVVRASDNALVLLDRNTNYFIFNSVPATAFTAGALYRVRVAVMTTGFWSPFGDVCEITAPGAAGKGLAPDAAALVVSFKASAYPNPFTSDFGLDIETSSRGDVQLKIYDMLGKLLESRVVEMSALHLEKIGSQYPSGVYNVIVTQDERVKTLRVVKR